MFTRPVVFQVLVQLTWLNMALGETLFLLVREGSDLDYLHEKVLQTTNKKDAKKSGQCQKQYKESRGKRLRKQSEEFSSNIHKENMKSGRKFLGLALQSIKRTPRNTRSNGKVSPDRSSIKACQSAKHERVPVSIASGYFVENNNKLKPSSSKNSERIPRDAARTLQTTADISSSRVLPKIVLSQEERDTLGKNRTRSWLNTRPRTEITRSLEPLEKSNLCTYFSQNLVNRPHTSGNMRNVTRHSFSKHNDAQTRKGRMRQYRNFNAFASLSVLSLPQREDISDSEAESLQRCAQDIDSRSDSYLLKPQNLGIRRAHSWTSKGDVKESVAAEKRSWSIEVFLPSVKTTEY